MDGNRRLALAGAIAFLGMNGWRLTLANDEAYDLVIAVASGELDDLAELASRLRAGSGTREIVTIDRIRRRRHGDSDQ